MDPQAIRLLFDYNYWAFERVWACILPLTDEQFVHPVDYSTGSIRNIVVHMMSATQRWMLRLQRAPMPTRLTFDEFPTKEKTRAKWDELKAETMMYVESLTQVQLNEVIRWELADRGIVAENPRWELLLHAANHGTDHRAQILTLLNQYFGVKTVEQDMILYLTEPQERQGNP